MKIHPTRISCYQYSHTWPRSSLSAKVKVRGNKSNFSYGFLFPSGNNGNGVGSSSSHESMVNLLDEGLGTSLDGTDEIPTISSAHSTLGRNDSGNVHFLYFHQANTME